MLLLITAYALALASCTPEATPATLLPATATPGAPATTVTPTATPGVYQLRVWGELMGGEGPWAVKLYAEITGGPDSSPEMHCQGTKWDFGDGTGEARLYDCIQWNPEYALPRHFDTIHWYYESGTYTVQFAYGSLESATTVEVR